MFTTVITFLAIFSFIVFVHELGHFLMARLHGVLVEEFGLGMPPRMVGVQLTGRRLRLIWGTRSPQDIKHTIYSLNWLPLGGFVKLYGDGAGGEGGHIDPHLAHRALDRATPLARLSIMVAGVVMNILLAIVIYSVLLSSSGYISDKLPVLGSVSFDFGVVRESIAVSRVRPDSPASRADLRPGQSLQRVCQLSGETPVDCQDITQPDQLIEYVKRVGERTVQLTLQDIADKSVRTAILKPVFDQTEKRPLIGIQLVRMVSLDYSQSPLTRLTSGAAHAWNLTKYNALVLSHLISESVRQRDPSIAGDALSGPVAIGSVVDETIKRSGGEVVRNLANLMALISLSLAFMNILPIPALDGGRIALILPELLTGRRVSARLETRINTIGFIALIALSILITFKDVFLLVTR